MAKQTKQQRIDELESSLTEIYKKIRYGLSAQIKRKDRDPVKVGETVAANIIEIISQSLPDITLKNQ